MMRTVKQNPIFLKRNLQMLRKPKLNKELPLPNTGWILGLSQHYVFLKDFAFIKAINTQKKLHTTIWNKELLAQVDESN